MKCPHCQQNHPAGTQICPVTGSALTGSQGKPGAMRTSDTVTWFGVGIIGAFLFLLGLAMLNNFSIADFFSNINLGRNSRANNLYKEFVDILITQLDSRERQFFTFGYDFNDTRGTVEFEDQNIYILQADSNIFESNRTQISLSGRSRNPVWSPDGRYIAFVVFGSDNWDNGWIVVYDIEREQERIIRGNFVPNYLSWSPDGTRIAFSDIQHDNISILNLSTEAIEIVDRDGHWVDGPTWSLDGRFLAYVQTKGTNTNDNDSWVLKLLDLETKKVSQITTTNDNIGVMRQKEFILWTADGKNLIYVRFNLVNGERQPYELWVLNPLTLDTYPLDESVYVVHQSFFPWVRLWSPTAENVLNTTPIDQYDFSSSSLASSGSGSGSSGSSQGSGQQPAATRTLRPTSPPAPTSTPSPTKTPAPDRPPGNPMIAYALGDFDEAELYILYVNTGKTIRITNNIFEDKSPSFSPDNKKLVYQSNRDQGWELYTYDLETGEEKRITTFNAEAKFPNWSPVPGDNRIVFEGRQGVYGRYDINVWMVNSDGTGMKQLTFSNADNRPIWSGDGSQIIFGRATEDSNKDGRVSSSDNLDIFTLDPQSEEITQITKTAEIDEFQFGSSPDGTLIAFCAISSDANRDGHRNLSDTRDLHFINMDGSNRYTIPINNQQIYSPDFSPDGQFITFNIWFNDDDSAIWMYNLLTEEITKLTGNGPYYHPEWSH